MDLELNATSDAFEKFMDEFRTKSFLSKEDYCEIFKIFEKARRNASSDGGEGNWEACG